MQLKWAYIACDVLASIAGLIDVPVIFERAVIKLAPLAFQTCLISLSPLYVISKMFGSRVTRNIYESM